MIPTGKMHRPITNVKRESVCRPAACVLLCTCVCVCCCVLVCVWIDMFLVALPWSYVLALALRASRHVWPLWSCTHTHTHTGLGGLNISTDFHLLSIQLHFYRHLIQKEIEIISEGSVDLSPQSSFIKREKKLERERERERKREISFANNEGCRREPCLPCKKRRSRRERECV